MTEKVIDRGKRSKTLSEVIQMTVSRSTYLLVYLSLQSHRKDWLTYYGGTDTPGELFIIFLSQTTTLIVCYLDLCDSHNPALLDLFIFSDFSICSAIALPSLGNSDNVIVSVSINFLSNQPQVALFYCITCNILVLIGTVSGQVLLISIVSSCLCCCNGSQKSLFCFHQKYKSSESKIKFRHTSNCCKEFLKLPKLHMLIKKKESITSQKFDFWEFWQIANSVLNKSKSDLFLLFSSLDVQFSASDKAKLFAKNFSISF